VPHTKGLNLSGVWQYNSGTPFTITDSNTDPNRNGVFEEPLAAGSYSGAANNVNAITVENTGGFNGARGPDFSLASIRAQYQFKLPGSGNRRIRTYVDIFNVTNRANFNNPTADRRDAATFLILRSIRNGGPSRTACEYDFQTNAGSDTVSDPLVPGWRGSDIRLRLPIVPPSACYTSAARSLLRFHFCFSPRASGAAASHSRSKR
jgi:hypothetical protein